MATCNKFINNAFVFQGSLGSGGILIILWQDWVFSYLFHYVLRQWARWRRRHRVFLFCGFLLFRHLARGRVCWWWLWWWFATLVWDTALLEYKRTGGPLNPKPLAGSGQTNSGLPDCEDGKDEDCNRRLKGTFQKLWETLFCKSHFADFEIPSLSWEWLTAIFNLSLSFSTNFHTTSATMGQLWKGVKNKDFYLLCFRNAFDGMKNPWQYHQYPQKKRTIWSFFRMRLFLVRSIVAVQRKTTLSCKSVACIYLKTKFQPKLCDTQGFVGCWKLLLHKKNISILPPLYCWPILVTSLQLTYRCWLLGQ